MILVKPSEECLPGYVAALEGDHKNEWLRADYKENVLEQIRTDPKAFLTSRYDPEGIRSPEPGRPVTPYVEHWMWDGEFCGLIAVRWQPGTNDLPAPYTSNVGYQTVPGKRGRGYATQALSQILPIAKDLTGLDHVVLSTTLDNSHSQGAILANGGEKQEKPRKMSNGHLYYVYHIPLPELGAQSMQQHEQNSTSEGPTRRLGSSVRRGVNNGSVKRGPR